MALIGQAITEEKMFKIVYDDDNSNDDDDNNGRRSMDTISSPYGPKGSGELKTDK